MEAVMSSEMLNKFWLLTTLVLIILIIITGFLFWHNHDVGQPLMISSGKPLCSGSQITLDGSVVNPGSYILKTDDTVDTLIRASGGLKDNADISHLILFIPEKNSCPQPQKINLNRADLWLLQALPGIGETRARAIIDFRSLNGPFNNIQELSKVPGIGSTLFEKIKDLITVTEF
jgi:competence protein ComEA